MCRNRNGSVQRPFFSILAAILLIVTGFESFGAEGTRRVEFLLNNLESAQDFKVRIASATALGKIADGTVADWMLRAFRKEENPAVRLATLYAIGEIPDCLIVPPLLEAISEVLLSEQEIVAIERIIWNFRIAIPKMEWARTLITSQDRSEKAIAAYLLGLVGDPSVLPVLAYAFHDRVAYVRMRAVQAVGRTGSPHGKKLCEKMLLDSDPSVARAAQICLGEIDLTLKGTIPEQNRRQVDLKIDLRDLKPNSVTPDLIRTYQKRNANPRALEQAIAMLQPNYVQERIDPTFQLVKSETTRDTFRMKADLMTSYHFAQADLGRLRSIVKDNAGYVNQCYIAALRNNRKLAGNITAKFMILSSGSVSNVELVDATLQNADVHKCMIERVSKLPFPEIPIQYVVMKYTFSFVPPKDEKFEFEETSLAAEQRTPGATMPKR